MGSQDSWRTIPVASLVIVASAILFSPAEKQTDIQTDVDERYTFKFLNVA